MVSTGLTQSLSLVDTAFVARLGTEAVAAVSAASTVVRVLVGVGTGIATSVLAHAARSAGACDAERGYRIATHGLAIASVVGVVLAGVCSVFQRPILSIFSGDPEVLDAGVRYLSWMLAGAAALFIYLSEAAVFQGAGDTRTPLLVIGSANIVNLILDPILMFELGLGVAGAGLASFIAHVGAASAGMWALFRSRRRPVRRGAVSAQPALVASIARIAGPASVQAMMRPVSGAILLYFVSVFGTSALAAFGIGLRLTMFCSVFMTGLTAGVGTLVGQQLGADSVDGARRTISSAALVGGLFFVLFGALYLLFPGPLMRLFVPAPEVYEIGVGYLRILSPSLMVLGIMAALSGTFQGSGDTRSLMAASIAANLPLKLGLAALFAFLWPGGVEGIWIAITVSIFAETLLLYVWYRTGRWHRHSDIPGGE